MMKKAGFFLMAAAIAGGMLIGCGAKQTVFSPTDTCVYVAEDGRILSALVEPYEGTIENEDLKKYLQAAVISYNEANGAEGKAENNPASKERLPVALVNLEKTDTVIKAVFEYASVEDLLQFRQTDANEDNSNTLTALTVKPAAEATDWFLAQDFTQAGSSISLEELKADAEGMAVYIEGGGTIQFAGKVCYTALDAEQKDEYTIIVPDGGKAYVVFK